MYYNIFLSFNDKNILTENKSRCKISSYQVREWKEMDYSVLGKGLKRVVNSIGGISLFLMAVAGLLTGLSLTNTSVRESFIENKEFDLLNLTIKGNHLLEESTITEHLKIELIMIIVAIVGVLGLLYFINCLISTASNSGLFSKGFLNYFRGFILFSVVMSLIVTIISTVSDNIVLADVSRFSNELVLKAKIDYISIICELIILLVLHYAIRKGIEIKTEQELTI